MKKVKISLAAVALLLATGITYATTSKSTSENVPCKSSPFLTEPDMSYNPEDCQNVIEVICCFDAETNLPIRKTEL
ncbi:DUF6520 family protein [Pedobacter nanyangensis]|uniref:DUF6520 family protein n=1 Tax=Pedobacter nanyangensis TaxID=1562389 RepID=UPI0013B3E4DB|nr:DUF6520 family protein [Pedobacter nanyangensis]